CSHAGIPAAFEIAQFVTNHKAVGEVDTEFVPGIEEELRRRLAAAARNLRRFGRNIDPFEANTATAKFFNEAVIDEFNFRDGEVAASDAGLVGDDKELESGGLQSRQS